MTHIEELVQNFRAGMARPLRNVDDMLRESEEREARKSLDTNNA